MEALRYLPYLAADGCVITNSDPFINIKNYPEIEKVNAELAKLPKCVSFNANQIAKDLNARGNMVLLGAAAPYLEIEFAELEKAIQNIFGRKGEAVVNTNIAAIRAGRDAK
ncbi:MAG: 2-oxoacid:acceptor oxidoreductase family protein, partial [Bacteroidales bacterium]|nr:2-oxoacid:acceptor oxidoreductase family protein [Bacteroidales bacterium]